MSHLPQLPPDLADKVQTFGEASHGATRATLVLADGRRVPDVSLAWGQQIVRIGGRDVSSASDLGFALEEIVDVTPGA